MAKEKKAKELIPKTAEQCNIDEELTKDIIDFYYSKLRKKIEKLEDPIIKIPVLGRLIVSKTKIDRSIIGLCEKIKELEPQGFKEMRLLNIYRERLDSRIDIQSKLNREKYELEQRKRNLEQSKQDSGGN